MGRDSKIEWTDHTFNPWWGCAKVSPGCDNCYAEAFDRRFGAHWGPGAPRKSFGDRKWREPLAWDRAALESGTRARVFCASMADVFEVRVDLDPWRARLWDLVRSTSALDWLLLTKRPRSISVPSDLIGRVWIGTSVEDQERAEIRIPRLLEHAEGARIRWLSLEPLLGPVDLRPWLDRIDWVVLGGESGPGARPMDPAWARAVRDACLERGVPFLIKQWGAHGADGLRRDKRANGRELDGRTWHVVLADLARGETA